MMRHMTPKFKAKIHSAFYSIAFLTALLLPIQTTQAQLKGLSIIRDTEIENTFEEWAEPLLQVSNIGEDNVRIILVQSDQINAFVAGGANIFFYTGLITKSENPGEVIGVMAHEMGHIAGGHLISTRLAYERASYESILGAVLGIGVAVLTGEGAAASAIIGGSQNIAGRRFLSHSRVNESSADQAAFKYLSAAHINPQGLSTFLEKLSGQDLLPASQQSEYVRTHPLTTKRIDAVDTLIAKSEDKDKPYPERWVRQHVMMKAKLIGFTSPERVGSIYPDSDTSTAARYARAIAAYRLNDVPTALRLMDDLIVQEPNNPYYLELKGQMLVDFGRVQAAIPHYEQAVQLLPDAALIRIALAHALMESQGSDDVLKDAVEHLERAVIKEPNSTRVHRLLATAYGRLGQDNLAKLHLAEEAVLQRRLPYAKAQAEAALKGFDTGSREWIKAKDILNHINNLEQL